MRLEHPILRAGLVLIALGLSSCPASGSLTIVLDVDDNPGNGPDTVVVGTQDTTSVAIWATGDADSFNLIAVNLWDPSGALVPAMAMNESIYATPGGWRKTRPAVSNGRLVLSSMDTTGATCLRPPVKIAEVSFRIVAGDSCGSVQVDTARTLWWYPECGPGEPVSLVGISICVAQVGEGSGEERTEGDLNGNGIADENEKPLADKFRPTEPVNENETPHT